MSRFRNHRDYRFWLPQFKKVNGGRVSHAERCAIRRDAKATLLANRRFQIAMKAAATLGLEPITPSPFVSTEPRLLIIGKRAAAMLAERGYQTSRRTLRAIPGAS